jgi:thymidylate synthase ThyX
MSAADQNTRVFVYDDLHPEDNAMVQALYSRSPNTVVRHMEKVREAGSGKFMERFYIGYGHSSIGDCGSTTIFIEDVSMLVAKAIQDNALYSGQEASTRYLDFSQQSMIDPYGSEKSAAIQRGWMDIYNYYMPEVRKALGKIYPYNEAEYKSEKSWQNAINARAFDTLRSLLPVGTTTLLSWHTNLRQARDHLRYLKSHPLEEVRSVASKVFDSLCSRYSNSFNGEEMSSDSERYRERDEYAAGNSVRDHVLMPEELLAELSEEQVSAIKSGKVIVDDALLDAKGANRREREVFAGRPKGAPLNRRLLQYGVYNLSFLLDFGSFRDLQRHRNGYCPVPLISGQFGFHQWYLDELENILPAESFAALKGEIEGLLEMIDNLEVAGMQRDPLKDQYLFPMGMACLCQLSYSIPQMVYVSELRSGKTVHPSLRLIAHQMGRALEQRHPDLKFYCDYDQDSWTAKRGDQDITERKAG